MTEIERLFLFEKDVKRLKKDHRTIDYDVTVFLQALLVRLPDRLPGTVRIPLGREYEH